MNNEQATPETKGVMVKLLAALDLGPELEGMAGRQLRMGLVTIEPGGVFGPMHDHKDRPGMVYILQGTITDHRNGVAKDYGPGVGWPEDRNTTHWLENRGRIPAVEISVDIARQEYALGGHLTWSGRTIQSTERSRARFVRVSDSLPMPLPARAAVSNFVIGAALGFLRN
ncbi:cupin domain-containing protein [Desulfatirhabdium butyrativorans]|uniref:cupin domain-containing protein n=1 Tax=Desulfatirhabdium butyrativorans TaxID=340467 RepID=UPI000A04E7E3|nr:cupin domain-containing protein [Desulfatirhabdium butyrativorans]